MSRTIACFIVIVGASVASLHAQTDGAPGGEGPVGTSKLQVYLPREISVSGNLINLGQVSVVRGSQTLVAAVSDIGLGRFSAPGQKITLDRPTILSRLASNGVSPEQVRLTGAESITVRRDQKVISSEDFVEMSQQFLMKHPPTASKCEAIAVIHPKDLVLPGRAENIEFSPRLVAGQTAGRLAVQIDVKVNGESIGIREIPFRLRYECLQAVAAKPIAEGDVFSTENLSLVTVMADRPQTPGWKAPYGMTATRTLPEGVEIRDDMFGPAKSDVVIRRNETVVIRIERPGFLVTAVGTALQQAHAGEYVKVKNMDSNRVIVCRVSADGTVEPML
jgi:flagella basal body P-ring formation protein FlgA